MLLDFTRMPNIFIVCGKTDLRKGIDGLAAFITEMYQLDVFDQALFRMGKWYNNNKDTNIKEVIVTF